MPYCLKATDFEQYINKYNSCLKSENGDASLKRKHAYYYQTQQQIFTAGKPYCDFVVCATRNTGKVVYSKGHHLIPVLLVFAGWQLEAQTKHATFLHFIYLV